MGKRASSTTAAPRLGPDCRIVILHGPEQMRQREALQQLREGIAAAHGDVEPIWFDGRQAELAEVLDQLRTASMFQRFNLVVVDEAETFVSRHREALERYAQSPVPDSCLVLRSATWRAGNFDKYVAKVGAKVKCDPVSMPDAKQWVLERAGSIHGCKIAPAAAENLVRRRGCDLMALDSELGKLAAMAGGGPITAEMVEQAVGRSSDEQVWVIQEALIDALIEGEDAGEGGRGDRRGGGAATAVKTPTAAGRAIEKLHELIDLAGHPEVLVTWATADLVRRLYIGLMMRRQGAAESDIARRLKLFGRIRSPFLALLRRLRPEPMQRLFDRIVEADRRSKSGLGTAVLNLECFCALLADEVR